ncbi:MAG: hypothetical protein ABJE47_08630 [bacterium]
MGRGPVSVPPFVLVLVPCTETADPSLDYYNDYSQSREEFSRTFAELGFPWRWQPVTPRTFREVLTAFAEEMSSRATVVFNLCDGDETNDVPGISVIHCLNELGLVYTGADASFYEGTTSKIDMKRAFDLAGVSTSPWEVIKRDQRKTSHLFDRLGMPLIVKPAVSAGSMGITIKSVVGSNTLLREQVRLLHDGYRGWDLVSGGVFVERYIAGPEFTTFIVGAADDPDRRTVYPPIERAFHAALPANEQFLSYDRLWEVYERETPLGDGEYLWQYRPAPASLRDRIQSLSWDAYVAVGGCGYGRVDLRMDAASGELYVLEVNAQCGLSEDEDYTSIGAILRFANRSFAGLVREIIDGAVVRRPAEPSFSGS